MREISQIARGSETHRDPVRTRTSLRSSPHARDSITNFGQVLAIVGLLGFGVLGMLFPVLCSLKIRGGRGLLTLTQIAQHVLVLVLGLATIILGLKAVHDGGANEVK